MKQHTATSHDSPSRDDATWTARVHLAAANRLAVYHQLEEGIDNHFTAVVPGAVGEYLTLPFGMHWSEARASDMLVFDEAGALLRGNGPVEITAANIHAPVHRISGANVVLHTHQPWALALNMLEDNRLLVASQSAAFLARSIAYDNDYAGLAGEMSEGERLAAVLGDKHILFMKNHGVLVIGETVAQAYRRLYRLELACRAQILAMSTGRPLAMLSDNIVNGVQKPIVHDPISRTEREDLFFEAMMRILDRVMPGYAD